MGKHNCFTRLSQWMGVVLFIIPMTGCTAETQIYTTPSGGAIYVNGVHVGNSPCTYTYEKMFFTPEAVLIQVVFPTDRSYIQLVQPEYNYLLWFSYFGYPESIIIGGSNVQVHRRRMPDDPNVKQDDFFN